jgi:hypothetical protein
MKVNGFRQPDRWVNFGTACIYAPARRDKNPPVGFCDWIDGVRCIDDFNIVTTAYRVNVQDVTIVEYA